MTIQPQNLLTMGILLLALVTVEYGGYFLTTVVRGTVPTNDLQKGFFRAGHAHAGILVLASFAILGVIDHAELTGIWAVIGRDAVPASAILMPAGFFLSVVGRNPAKPNRLIVLLWIGAVVLTAGLVTAGLGFLFAGIRGLA